jgi:hypothetical protein
MLRYNVIDLLATFAVLALCCLLLVRAAALAPAGKELTNEATGAAQPAGAVEIRSYPADAIIIEALPAKD